MIDRDRQTIEKQKTTYEHTCVLIQHRKTHCSWLFLYQLPYRYLLTMILWGLRPTVILPEFLSIDTTLMGDYGSLHSPCIFCSSSEDIAPSTRFLFSSISFATSRRSCDLSKSFMISTHTQYHEIFSLWPRCLSKSKNMSKIITIAHHLILYYSASVTDYYH